MANIVLFLVQLKLLLELFSYYHNQNFYIASNTPSPLSIHTFFMSCIFSGTFVKHDKFKITFLQVGTSVQVCYG